MEAPREDALMQTLLIAKQPAVRFQPLEAVEVAVPTTFTAKVVRPPAKVEEAEPPTLRVAAIVVEPVK